MPNEAKIAFIESNSTKLAPQFNAVSIEYNSQTTDRDIENWIQRSLFDEYPNIEKLVIPARLGRDDIDYMGLRVGLHIRLTEKFGDKRFITLIFLSEQSKEAISLNQVFSGKEKTVTLLNTPNCLLVEFDEEAINNALSKEVKILDEGRFRKDGLPKIIIENQRDRGHQLANEWGCMRLAKLAGYEMQEKSPDLYLKYRLAKMSSEIGFQAVIPKNILLDKDIKVLLIDDNADKGWKEVIEHVLKKYVVDASRSVDVTVMKSEADFINRIVNIEQFDIVLLDLRLSKDEEKPNRATKIEDFSGSRVLKRIKEVNQGIQVIILTASNKAWNMKYLLDLGADGYYVKESPRVVVTNEFSQGGFENFIESIKLCIEREEYLKKFFKRHKDIKDKLNALILPLSDGNEFKEMLKEIRIYFDISFDMVYAASSETDNEKRQNRFGYAYLSLFRVIEKINDFFIDRISPFVTHSHEIKASPPIILRPHSYDENTSTSFIIETVRAGIIRIPLNFGNGPQIVPSTFGICKDRLGLTAPDFISKVYWAIQRRHKFIHADTDLTSLHILYLTECPKIRTDEGYKELLEILEKMIVNPNFV